MIGVVSRRYLGDTSVIRQYSTSPAIFVQMPVPLRTNAFYRRGELRRPRHRENVGLRQLSTNLQTGNCRPAAPAKWQSTQCMLRKPLFTVICKAMPCRSPYYKPSRGEADVGWAKAQRCPTPPRRHLPPIQPFQQGCKQHIGIKRFGNEIIHPDRKTTRLVFGKGIGGHGQNRGFPVT